MDSQAAQFYDAYYYSHGCGEPYQRTQVWLDLFNAFSERIQRDIAPASVLDAGCAMGFLVEGLRSRGVAAWGIDISDYAIANVHESIRDYCWVGSVSQPFPRRYDLIVSIEVLEHLQQAEAEKAVENFCQWTDDVLFSSTPLDHKEATHFNVQPVEYWAELFARHGFYQDIDFDATFITPWSMRFRRRREPFPRIVRDYARKMWLVTKEINGIRGMALDMRQQLADADQKIQALQAQLAQASQAAPAAAAAPGLVARLAGWWRRLSGRA